MLLEQKILQPSPRATDFHIAVKIIIEHKFVSFSDGGSCCLPAFFEDRHGFWSDIRRSQERTEHFTINSESSIKKFQPARDWKLIRLLQSSLFLGPGKEEKTWKPGCLPLQPLFGSFSDYVGV